MNYNDLTITEPVCGEREMVLRIALRELVRLKNLKDKYSKAVPTSPHHPDWQAYRDFAHSYGRDKAAAWKAAREALGEL